MKEGFKDVDDQKKFYEMNEEARKEEKRKRRHKRKEQTSKIWHELYIQFGIPILFILIIMAIVSFISFFTNETWWINLTNVSLGILASLIASYISTIFKPKK